VYISSYCPGGGVAGTMVTGLLSHLMGGAYPAPGRREQRLSLGASSAAPAQSQRHHLQGLHRSLRAFMGVGTSAARPTPDPFQEPLVPEVAKYCK
jgi:hypothetical protein